MKIKSLISLAIFAAFIVSCEKDMKWINPDDSKADQSEIGKICEEKSAECGMIEYEYLGKTRKVFCGKCEEGYDCNSNNKCEKIGGDNDPVSDDTDTKPDEDSDTTPDDDADTGSFEDTDMIPDKDTDMTSDNEPDEDENSVDEDIDTDTIPADPCDPNPCTGISNSTGVCTATGTENYFCGCNSGYFWNGSECHKQIALGNICTGQNKCYNNTEEITCPTSPSDDFFGQDAQYTSKCTAQSFNLKTIFKQTVVVDYNTGLTWEQSPSKNSYTWDDAPNHCADLNNSNYGGKSNWRVPNPLELLTIVDNSRYNPALNSNFTAFSDKVWTSKEYKGNTDYAYVFIPYSGMYYGKDSAADYSKNFHQQVLCVSGDEMQPATSDNFTTQTINEAVVVKDSATGLMWQKEYTTGNWGYALKYCEDSTYADYSDWRLPNKNELASLINYEKPEAPYSYFPDMPSDWFWSSSTRVNYTSSAWTVNFNGGYVDGYGKTYDSYVRCVRNADEEDNGQEPETLLTLDSHEKTANSYSFILSYHGSAAIDFAASIITLNGAKTTNYEYNEITKKFTIVQSGLEPNKYSWLFRLVDKNGNKIEPFFIPFWIGNGVDYGKFGWRDAFIYQIITDRFLDGDSNNNVPESGSPHVTKDLEKWKGGDFRGIIQKIEDNYFTNMGVNAIWISNPTLNPHYESQGGTSSSMNNAYFTSYHAYHPIATGYSFDNDYGFDNEGIETAFGTADELRELVEKAHKKGIRIIPDFIGNHTYIEAQLYQQHQNDGWFNSQELCGDLAWEENVMKTCWFTQYMPDFNYNNTEARKEIIKHAIWLIQNFNFDGFRTDALKHMEDIFIEELRAEIKAKIETTVSNHDMPEEAEVFYMLGESLGGDWPRYHIRSNMVQGQVNDKLYHAIKESIFLQGNYSSLASKVMNPNDDCNDEAYLLQPEGKTGGFPGAVMGNFFGNHDQDRALSECNGDYVKFKHAQTFLLTTPINIPIIYQGDDIGMEGKLLENGFDGERRAVMKFTSLSSDEQAALQHVRNLGKFRKAHPALRKGTRSTCASTNDAWVYKFIYEGKTVVVGINKGDSAYTATCSGVSGSFTSYDGSNVNVSGGSVTVPAGGSLVIGN